MKQTILLFCAVIVLSSISSVVTSYITVSTLIEKGSSQDVVTAYRFKDVSTTNADTQEVTFQDIPAADIEMLIAEYESLLALPNQSPRAVAYYNEEIAKLKNQLGTQ